MSEFANFGPGMEIHYTLGSDGAYRMVTKDTHEEVIDRFGSIPMVDIVYMYPPIGAQRVNMGRQLFEQSESFKEVCRAHHPPVLFESNTCMLCHLFPAQTADNALVMVRS